jgi:hypothetical protein
MHTAEYGAVPQCKYHTFKVYSMATGARIQNKPMVG